MSQQPITRPPGWYPDPIDDGRQRWWDGSRWVGAYMTSLGDFDPADYRPERLARAGRPGRLTPQHWLILGGVAAALLFVVALSMDTSTAIGFVLFVLLGALWLSPGIIASKRGHRNAGGIWVVTLLLGWTVIGWVVALAMALSDPGPRA